MKNILKIPFLSRTDRFPYRFRQSRSSEQYNLLNTFDDEQIQMDDLEANDENPSNRTKLRRNCEESQTKSENADSMIIVEKPILPNETIQAFAIRFRVPLARLRRLNNIQNDQEFHALTTCRVPVRRFGILHQPLVDLDETPIRSIPVTHLTQENHAAFLQAVDQDLAEIRNKIENSTQQPRALDSLDNISNNPLILRKDQTNYFNCDESSCSCKLWQIIVLLIIIALIPFVYVYLYLKYHQGHGG